VGERLTAKQERFVQEIIKGKSQREAYKIAYDANGMADSTIDASASRMLRNVKVKDRYEQLQNKVITKAEEQSLMTVTEVLKEIESIAKDDISRYLDFRTEMTLVGRDKETGEPIFDYAPIVELKDSRKIDTKNVQEVSLGANGSFKFKTYCRDTALYKLLDLYGTNAVEQAKLQLMRERLDLDKDTAESKKW
jgi:phage terminase small subunit